MNADDADWNEQIDRQKFLRRLQIYKRIHWSAITVVPLSCVIFFVYLIVMQLSNLLLGQAVFVCVLGSCILVLSGLYGVVSWTMDADQFSEFVQFVSLRGRGLPEKRSKTFWLWNQRISAIIFFLVGLIPTLIGLRYFAEWLSF